MVNLKREGLGLLLKLGRAVALSADAPEEPEEATTPAVNTEAEPMKAYWESDKEELNKKNQPFIDLFLKDVALNRIPDTTEKPVQESHYSYETLGLVYLPENLKNFNPKGNVLLSLLPLVSCKLLNHSEDTQILLKLLGILNPYPRTLTL